jgi:SAM-dependent methyltransferase
MSHTHDIDPAVLVTQAFWDDRYGSANQIWSGNPNQRLVEQVADLAPGSALEVGCGEGADAIWLATRGWQVTAVDVSTVALARAARQATAVGADVAERINWQQADILSWQPTPRQFDLVTAHFIHVPAVEREPLHRRFAEAVRPGGTLLIVGHHPSDLETRGRSPSATRPSVRHSTQTASQSPFATPCCGRLGAPEHSRPPGSAAKESPRSQALPASTTPAALSPAPPDDQIRPTVRDR